jgi:hypothetical protein
MNQTLVRRALLSVAVLGLAGGLGAWWSGIGIISRRRRSRARR